MINPEINPLILKEFNGKNHVELAGKYITSVQYIYSLVLNQRIANAVQSLHLNEESGQQVLWAGQATQLDHQHGLRAALQALEKAADLDSSGRALVVIAYLPEAPLTDPDDDSHLTSPAGSAEIQPSNQSRDCKETGQPAGFQSDSLKHPDTSLLNSPIEPLTPEQIKAEFAAYGVTITDFCATHQLSRMSVVDLLRGHGLGLRGDSHRAAVILGLKPDPITKHINHPFQKERRAA